MHTGEQVQALPAWRNPFFLRALVRAKNSAFLLLVLGLLMAVPLVAKTYAAHGAVPALVTGLLVIAAVFAGPVTVVLAGSFDSAFVVAPSVTSDTGVMVVLGIGLAVLLGWLRGLLRSNGPALPYLTVTGWGMLGAWFCVSQVFLHIA